MRTLSWLLWALGFGLLSLSVRLFVRVIKAVLR